MDERNNNFDFDFTPIGQAIKKAREAKGMTREQLSGIIGYAPRHIQSIENEGQYPSIELFIQLITMFDVSVDEYIFPNKEVEKSSVRRRLDAQLNRLDDKELSVISHLVHMSDNHNGTASILCNCNQVIKLCPCFVGIVHRTVLSDIGTHRVKN